MKSSERKHQIAKAAVQVVAERGYYGMTIQEVADRVGLSQAGLLKYVKSKNGLLYLALEEFDDGSDDDYLNEKLSMTPEQLAESPALMPEWYRTLVAASLKTPQLTQLYLILRAEAINPKHPAHKHYAERGERLRRYVASIPWKLPPEYVTPKQIGTLSMTIGSALDGLELRWLGEPQIDLAAEWAFFEDVLFPLPHWEGYR